MPLSDAQRSLILDALVDPKPYCGTGVWSFPEDQLFVFLSDKPYVYSSVELFQTNEPLRSRISLARNAASVEELERLVAACQPATFGFNNADVLDESVRKAGKLDKSDFAINLDIMASGLLEEVNTALFGWETQRREIAAELYKLNVYGTSCPC